MKPSSTSYSMIFQTVEHPWNGAVVIFEDGQAKLYEHRLCLDRPVVVQVEGLTPNPEQIEVCRRLSGPSFTHCHDIMAPTKIPA
jgi:hypothetical protein